MKHLLRNLLLFILVFASLTAGTGSAAEPGKFLVIQNVGYVKLPADVQMHPARKAAGPAWDLIGKDKDVPRYARLMASEYPPGKLGVDKSLFTGRLQGGQVAQVGDSVKQYMTRYLAQNGGRLLTFYPTEVTSIDNRRAWVFSMRADLGYDISFPVFIKTYMLVTDYRVTEVMLVCPDGDRRFWDPVIRKAMASVERSKS